MTRLTHCLILIFALGCNTPQPTQPSQPVGAPRTDALAAQVDSATVPELPDVANELRPSGELAWQHTHDLQTLYAKRGFKPMWVSSDARPLTDDGESLYAALLDAEPVHGLWREDFQLDTIESAVEAAAAPPLAPPKLPADEIAALRAWEMAANPDDEQWQRALEQGTYTPTWTHASQARLHKRTQAFAARAKLDVLLSDALITYVRQMKWDNSAWTRPLDWSGTLKPQDNRAPTSVVAQLSDTFTKPSNVHAVLQKAVPPFGQYQQLTTAFQRYQEIVQNGGWAELPASAKGLRPGHKKPEVVALKKRLRAEGFWQGDDSEHYGPATQAAVLSYQQSHQLWEEGAITQETLASLNVPAERRLNQIRVTLQRWRESRLGRDKDFVFVNIPDFHAEVWRENKMERRFRVVTGASKQKWNPRTQQNEFVTATPLMSGRMDFVVFNPYWNIPNTIRWSEIEPKAAADPDYFAKENIERVTDSTGREYLRQLPGPHNALGVVKFMFPNAQDIYLHDTPDKGFFKWPTRAFSHGCVRVEDPVELAKTVLSHEGKWDETAVQAWFQRPTETWIKLDQTLPVHIEYYVVRVDELGRTNFLADVYLSDQDRLADVEARLRHRAEKADQDG